MVFNNQITKVFETLLIVHQVFGNESNNWGGKFLLTLVVWLQW